MKTFLTVGGKLAAKKFIRVGAFVALALSLADLARAASPDPVVSEEGMNELISNTSFGIIDRAETNAVIYNGLMTLGKNSSGSWLSQAVQKEEAAHAASIAK